MIFVSKSTVIHLAKNHVRETARKIKDSQPSSKARESSIINMNNTPESTASSSLVGDLNQEGEEIVLFTA
jgi:hypothetical protein